MAAHAQDVGAMDATDLEEERLAAFDRGYKAGWEDAASAHETEQARISADFAQTLNDLSFSYHEARASMIREMGEVVEGLLNKVLSPSASRALGDHVIDRLRPLIAERSTLQVTLRVAGQNVAAIERLVQGITQPPIHIRAEDTLGPGQAILQMEPGEQKIDIDAVLNEAAQMVHEFFVAVPKPADEERKVG